MISPNTISVPPSSSVAHWVLFQVLSRLFREVGEGERSLDGYTSGCDTQHGYLIQEMQKQKRRYVCLVGSHTPVHGIGSTLATTAHHLQAPMAPHLITLLGDSFYHCKHYIWRIYTTKLHKLCTHV